MVISVARASAILRMLGNRENRLTDISKTLGLNMSTTHRLLKTLEKEGFVFQDPISRQYLLGHLVLRIASDPFVTHQGLAVSALEEMKRLRSLTGETVTINIRIGEQRLCVEEMVSFHSIKYTIGRGAVAEIYAGSAGKVLLAELPKIELERLLRNITLRKVAPHTITDKDVLLKELEKIRKQGYAKSIAEKLEGGIAISAPVRGYVCPVSLTILAPEFRFGHVILKYVQELKRSAAIISKRVQAFTEEEREHLNIMRGRPKKERS